MPPLLPVLASPSPKREGSPDAKIKPNYKLDVHYIEYHYNTRKKKNISLTVSRNIIGFNQKCYILKCYKVLERIIEHKRLLPAFCKM